jgi:predicted nucleic acid-binding protein
VIYFDTSYLTRCYLNERGSNEVRALAQAHDAVSCCEYGMIELYASVHRNLRERNLSPRNYGIILRQIDRDLADNVWVWLPFTRAVLQRAVGRLKRLSPRITLRTGDALHLACAAENALTEIYSNDSHLLSAAHEFGLEGIDVIS